MIAWTYCVNFRRDNICGLAAFCLCHITHARSIIIIIIIIIINNNSKSQPWLPSTSWVTIVPWALRNIPALYIPAPYWPIGANFGSEMKNHMQIMSRNISVKHNSLDIWSWRLTDLHVLVHTFQAYNCVERNRRLSLLRWCVVFLNNIRLDTIPECDVHIRTRALASWRAIKVIAVFSSVSSCNIHLLHAVVFQPVVIVVLWSRWVTWRSQVGANPIPIK